MFLFGLWACGDTARLVLCYNVPTTSLGRDGQLQFLWIELELTQRQSNLAEQGTVAASLGSFLSILSILISVGDTM